MIFRISTGAERDRNGDHISDATMSAVRENALELAADLFGGATAFDHFGSFRMNNGDVVVERGFTVEVVVLGPVGEVQHRAVDDLAVYIRDGLAQESVLVTIVENDARLV